MIKRLGNYLQNLIKRFNNHSLVSKLHFGSISKDFSIPLIERSTYLFIRFLKSCILNSFVITEYTNQYKHNKNQITFVKASNNFAKIESIFFVHGNNFEITGETLRTFLYMDTIEFLYSACLCLK